MVSRRIRERAQQADLHRIRGQAQQADLHRIRGQAQQADLHRIRGQAQQADLHRIRERAQQAASRRIKDGNSGNSVHRGGILYLKGTAIKVGGIFLAITGYLGMIVTLIIGLMLLLGSSVTGWQMEINVMAALMGGFSVAFAVMGIIGTSNACTVSRFGKYVKMIGNREYCDVKEFAQQSGRSVKAVVKDLKKMIKKGWFRQGHLDEQETCLMTSNEAYRQYTALMERTRREKQEKEERAAKEQEEFSRLSPEVQKIIEAGDEYVRAIKAANDAIPGEEISEKIARMEMLVDRIFDRVEQKPDTVSDIRKLMDYYLPMTMKLLQAYEDLDAQPVQGENIISSKIEIEKTIDTLNVAFEKLLDERFSGYGRGTCRRIYRF